MTYMSIVDRSKKLFSEIWRWRKKSELKKRKFGLYEFPRPLYLRLEDIELNDLTMKRIAAFIIDYVILCALASVVGTAGMIAVADKWMQEPSRYFIWFMLATFIGSILLMVICFFIWDVYGELDLGKRLMKIELLSDGKKLTVGMAFVHSVTKTIVCCIWPISFTYYILKHEMVYDKVLRISVSSKTEG